MPLNNHHRTQTPLILQSSVLTHYYRDKCHTLHYGMFFVQYLHLLLCAIALLAAHYVLLMCCRNVAHYSLCVVLMLLTVHMCCRKVAYCALYVAPICGNVAHCS